MKKTFLSAMVMLITIASITTGCVEHRYYHEHHHHSPEYYHRHHMPPPSDVEIDVR